MAETKLTYRVRGEQRGVVVRDADGQTEVVLGDEVVATLARVVTDGAVVLRLPDGRTLRATVTRDGEQRWVTVGGVTVVLERETGRRPRGRSTAKGDLTSPLPGRVIAVDVDEGQRVHAGQTLVLIEAMKMEHPVKAPHDGVVVAVRCKGGDMVQPGVALVELRPEESA
jgi:biotin carboxyl carrier protein